MKLIFVSGGVISGLGKGITASSIGLLLKSRGLKVTAVKIDPYLNIDAGTMNPFEHGEVYVLNDGGEVDLDLGNYERFLDLRLGSDHNITTGKVYRSVIENERHGSYLGKTVQIIPHITNEIKRRILSASRDSGADIAIVELGGTVGDIESMPFLEAARQLGRDLGREDAIYVHTTLVPIMGTVGEEKTKPTQHSVRELMGLGIRPDVIVCRSSRPLEQSARSKIAMFCDVEERAVVSAPDARSIYEVPLILERQGLADFIIERMKLTPLTEGRKMDGWERFLNNILEPKERVTIAIVGKYTALADSYLSHTEALTHAGASIGCGVKVRFIDSDDFLKKDPKELLDGADGVLIPGGFGIRGVEGKIAAAQYARVNGIPFLGVCLGFQIATIEISRHVLGLEGADSTEFDPSTKNPVICMMHEQEGIEDMGGTMRLGAQTVILEKDSLPASLYGSDVISERHRHRYEVNPAYIDRLESSGWRFVGRSEDGKRMEVGVLDKHPYFVASQFHPEFNSRPLTPSPLHKGLVQAALAYKKG